MQEIQTLQSWIRDSQNIVFFGGAGVSTESNIPDFRSQDGLYHQSYQYPPETILSHRFFMQQTEEFFRFYREKMLYLQAQPNQAHLQLAKWEREGKIKGVITQNIDGLHQKAGSRHVVELVLCCVTIVCNAAKRIRQRRWPKAEACRDACVEASSNQTLCCTRNRSTVRTSRRRCG